MPNCGRTGEDPENAKQTSREIDQIPPLVRQDIPFAPTMLWADLVRRSANVEALSIPIMQDTTLDLDS